MTKLSAPFISLRAEVWDVLLCPGYLNLIAGFYFEPKIPHLLKELDYEYI